MNNYDGLQKSYLGPILEGTTGTPSPHHMIAFQTFGNQLPFITGYSIPWSCDHNLKIFFIGLWQKMPKKCQLGILDSLNYSMVCLTSKYFIWLWWFIKIVIKLSLIATTYDQSSRCIVVIGQGLLLYVQPLRVNFWILTTNLPRQDCWSMNQNVSRIFKNSHKQRIILYYKLMS